MIDAASALEPAVRGAMRSLVRQALTARGWPPEAIADRLLALEGEMDLELPRKLALALGCNTAVH